MSREVMDGGSGSGLLQALEPELVGEAASTAALLLLLLLLLGVLGLALVRVCLRAWLCQSPSSSSSSSLASSTETPPLPPPLPLLLLPNLVPGPSSAPAFASPPS